MRGAAAIGAQSRTRVQRLYNKLKILDIELSNFIAGGDVAGAIYARRIGLSDRGAPRRYSSCGARWCTRNGTRVWLETKALYQHLGIGQNDLEKRRVYPILKEMKLRIVIKYIVMYFY